MAHTPAADQFRKLLAHNIQLKLENFLKTTGPLTVAELAAVVRLDQEHHWRAGIGPRAETYFERFPQLRTDADTAVELIEAEFHLRRAAGERVIAGAFMARFPEFSARLHGRLPADPPANATTASDVFGRTLDRDPGASPAPLRSAGRTATPAIPGYEILGELARGAMGVIYKARQTRLNRLVAIKMVRGAETAESAELVRFLVEAEAIAAVKHNNVLNVYECGECQGRPYLVMEYVEGGTLAKWLRENGPFAPAEAAHLVERLARATQAAHDCGIVHRDLKPSNILLQNKQDGKSSKEDLSLNDPLTLTIVDPSSLVPKITDFGLAKRGGGQNLTGSRAIMGTPSYMAPEQARGETKFVGPSADIYALGGILYESLTGTVPFRNRDMWAVVQSVIHDPPEPPRKRNPKVPRDLNLICLRCLAKAPHERYETAGALADDLARFLRGEPVSVRPAGPGRRLANWANRHPLLAVLLVVLLIGAPVATGLAVWSHLQAENARQVLRAKEQLDREKGELMHRLLRHLQQHPADTALAPAELTAKFFAANPDLAASDEARAWLRQTIEAKPTGG